MCQAGFMKHSFQQVGLLSGFEGAGSLLSAALAVQLLARAE